MSFVSSIVFFGCVSAGALESPQVGQGGQTAPAVETTFDELDLTVTNLATGLDTPWDLVWGPDGWIWFTEREGRVSRVNPRSGEVVEVARIPSLERGESGLMGMELHPDFETSPYVYLMQSYEGGSGIANRLIRYTYEERSLVNETVLIDSILGNTYHDGARIAVGPDGYLYITTGDAGQERLSQDTSSLNGKVLRVTLEGEPVPDNPFGNEVFSYGHRNAQGLVFHPETDALYITEHGPRDNDEVAIVRSGENHGWPQVHGFCDNDVPGEEAFCASNDVVEPLAAWTPTIAPAGADFYDGTEISGWQGSFLFTTLKGGALVRLVLSADARRVVRQVVISEGRYGRLRDVLVGPDGAIYVATSNRDGRGDPAPHDDRILRIAP
ncbi:MAG: PQQ-dependent sugar dehydrogenase [Spirochaetota bacterium]